MVNIADVGFGRLEQFDDSSRLFQIAPVLEAAGIDVPRSYTWRPAIQLNQGNSGRCVGYSGAGELGGRPVTWATSNQLANALYELCCKRDAWPQNDNGDINFGTSVLALMQVMKELGFIPEYRWCGAGSGKALEDFTLSLGYKGPVLAGTVWYNSMMNMGPDGHIVVNASSGIVGGHAYYFYKTVIRWLNDIRPPVPTFQDVDLDKSQAHMMNSWGGLINGWMTLREVGHLQEADGEMAIPTLRTRTS